MKDTKKTMMTGARQRENETLGCNPNAPHFSIKGNTLMQYKGMLLALGGLLLVLTLPGLSNGQDRDQRISVEPITFTDDAEPMCDVNDALGLHVVPACGEREMERCEALGCPTFDYVNWGRVKGDLNGELYTCASQGDPVGDNFISVTACSQIITTDGADWRGPSTVTFKPSYGGLGQIFLQDEDGSTIRATLTTLSLSPSLSLNHGIIVHTREN